MTEYERRCKVVELRKAGKAPGEIAESLRRSRSWVHATVARYKQGGLKALKDRSRAPIRQPRATPPAMVNRILAARKALQGRGRGKRFCGIGADAIAWELHLRGCKKIPTLRTIERIVARAGITKAKRPSRPRNDPRPYPTPVASAPGDIHQSDVVGPRHLATAKGPVRFFSYHTVDVAGGGIACWQSQDRSADSYCRYLVECAWKRLGLPKIWQVDNEMALAGFPGRPESFTAPVRLALLLGIKVVFIPQGEPGRQAHVESFNALWQERVLRRFTCRTLSALRRTSLRFEDWFMGRRPHPQLKLSAYGARFPGAVLESLNGQLRRLGSGFTLNDYRGSDGRLHFPLAEGRVTWIRLVDEDGTIDIGGKRWPVGRRYANQYVEANVLTQTKTLTVTLNGVQIKQHPFLIPNEVVKPLRLK